jgi:branched-chain amino acid transport system substrate-binding protein
MPSVAVTDLREDVMKAVLGLAMIAASATAVATPVKAVDEAIKIGVLTDLSGIYAAPTGPGSFFAARLAVADFVASHKGFKVEVVAGDHQNKPDIGAGIANRWIDAEKVDAIVDVPTSSVAFVVNDIVKSKNKVFLASGAAASDLTGARCTPNTVHWTYDTWALANGTGKAIATTGGDSWFFLTADYAFGHALERDTAAVVEANKGKVVGRVRHALATNDFSSFLMQAQASKAKIIALANAGGDTVNAIKQAAEFGIVRGGQKLAGMLVNISDIDALGLKTAQGLMLTEPWYWDASDANRAFAKTFAAGNGGRHPTMIHAGVYAAVTHYLKAVVALNGAADGKAVVAKMKALPTDDPLFGNGSIRPDGRKIHDMYLFEVKRPEESKYPWDYYKVRATIPAAEAFRPLSQGGCPLVSG